MYDFLEGDIVEMNPSYLVLCNNGIGYFIHISLSTYSKISKEKRIKLYIRQIIKEDAHMLFGFSDKHERVVFSELISVSGIGANTARMILSSLNPDEVIQAIVQADINVLKKVKGIGVKSAQRMVIELKDKLGKGSQGEEIFIPSDNTTREDALSALVTLGFPKKNVQKVVDGIITGSKGDVLSVEQLVKEALKKL